MTAIPTAVAERTRRTPGAPFSADSIGTVTKGSISVGAMPRPSTRMVTVGAVRSGRTSKGTVEIAYPPQTRRATASAITAARLRRDQRIRASIMIGVLLYVVLNGRGRVPEFGWT